MKQNIKSSKASPAKNSIKNLSAKEKTRFPKLTKALENPPQPSLTKEDKEKVSTEIVLASMEERAQDHFKKLKKFTKKKITTKEEYNLVAENVKGLKAIDKEAKLQEDSIIEPIEESIGLIRDLFKPFHNKVKDWDTNAKLMLSVFLEEQKKKLAKVTAKFEAGKISKVSTYTSAVNEFSAPKGAAKVRKLKRVVIIDENSVPEKFKSPDIDKIEEALKNGEEVPGCKYEEVDNIAL